MPPRQRLRQRQHHAAARRFVAGQAGQRLRPGLAFQRGAQFQHGRVRQRVFQADEVVVLGDQRDEVQPKLLSRRLDARAHVGPATGHRRGHGHVAVFGLAVVATEAGCRDALLGQQVVHQQAGARARLPVDEARLAAGRRNQVGQATDAQRVTRTHHQPLGAAQAADQLVQTRLEQRLHGRRKLRRSAGQRRHMEARHQAAALGQRSQRIDAAGKTQLDVQAVRGGGQVTQPRQRQIVAGEEGQHMLAAIECLAQHMLQFGTQGLDVGCQPGAGALFGPQQAVGKRRQPRRLALHPADQRLAHHLFPTLEGAPDVAVRRAHRLGRVLDRAVFVQRAQQVEQRVVQHRTALTNGLEAVLQVDAAGFHGGLLASHWGAVGRCGLSRRSAA